MDLTQAQIRRLRETELGLLDAFGRVCEELGLRWFLVQGSLLGAVRHGGFIPWDDDIDVGMLREDFDRFVKEAPPLLPGWCFVQTHGTDPGYMQCFAKLRDRRTVFWETTYKNIAMEHGVYLDVFPYDRYPDGLLRAGWYELRKLLIRYRLRELYYIPSDAERSAANAVRAVLKGAARLCWPTTEGAFAAQERMIRSARGRRLINAGGPWGRRECLPESVLAGRGTLRFEGRAVPVMADYDGYLRRVYGDYMRLPPPEKRVPHHPVWKLSLPEEETGLQHMDSHVEDKAESKKGGNI